MISQRTYPKILDPLTWLAESSEFGRSHVYTNDILGPVKAAEAKGGDLQTIELPRIYLQNAGAVAQLRAATGAVRLALIWQDDL